MKDEREFIEQELRGKGKKIFLIIYPHESEIYIDTQGLPSSAMLCAMHDGVPFLRASVGVRKKVERNFVSIEWAIKEWGGPEDLVDALKKRKQIIINDLERMKSIVKQSKKAE